MSKSTIIYPSKDTFVCSDENSKNLNFGKRSNLLVDHTYTALLYFDLSSIPANAIITSAKLNIYLYRFHSDSNTTLNIKELSSSFYENTVTFNDKPSASSHDLIPDANKSKIIDPANINTFITFDNLTDTVSAWYNDIGTNHGFELSSISRSPIVSFFSKEYTEADLRPKLEVEYTLNVSVPPIETIMMPEILTISDNTIFSQSNIYDISNAIFFSYFIKNSFKGSDKLGANYIYIYIKSCSSKDGVFENIGDIISIEPGESKSFEVSTRNKYVCLSIMGSPNAKIRITAILKCFYTMTAPVISSEKVNLDTILLTANKPLVGTTADPSSFIITDENSPDESIPVDKAVISGNSITLTCSTTSDDLRLTITDNHYLLSYKTKGTDNLKDTLGYEILDFSNRPLEIATPYIPYSPEVFIFDTNPNDVNSTVYGISKLTSFKYTLICGVYISSNPSITISLFGSTYRDTIFTPIFENITYSLESPAVISISLESNYNYVFLKLYNPSNEYKNISLTPFITANVKDVPPILASATYNNATSQIKIEMNKSLKSTNITPSVFTTSYLVERNPAVDLAITKVEILDKTVTLSLNTTIPSDANIILIYKATDTNYLTGINGDVNNFTYNWYNSQHI